MQQSVAAPEASSHIGGRVKAKLSHTNLGAVQRGDTLATQRPDLAQQVRLGTLAPAKAYRELRRDSRLARLAALPPGDDQARMHALGITIQPFDVWTFGDCDEAFGQDKYHGRIPGQLVAQVLYFFTRPGEVVLDPMAGSGTTIDVCRALGRTCYGYDAQPVATRTDITPHDLRTGWPAQLPEADLIFWDPPYFVTEHPWYGDTSISRLPRQAYLAFFAQRFTEAYALVQPGTRLAFLMSDWTPNDEDATDGVFLWDYTPLITSAGWTLTRQIQVPLATQTVHGDFVTKFRTARRLARLNRWLLMAEKR